MVDNYVKREEEVKKNYNSRKVEELKKIKTETTQEINKKIEVSVGAGLSGIGNFTATVVRETTQRF